LNRLWETGAAQVAAGPMPSAVHQIPPDIVAPVSAGAVFPAFHRHRIRDGRGVDMTSNASLHQRRMDAVPRGVGNAYAIYAERASNAEIIDVEGKRLIDFAGGIAVLNTGHCHPKVVAAVTEAARQVHPHLLPSESVRAVYPPGRAAERHRPRANFPKKTIFLTTGAEAVENAVKIARAHTKRAAVIAFSGAFHGRTLMGMALTGKYQPYKVGFGPFPTDIYHVPFPETNEKDGWQKSLKALETCSRPMSARTTSPPSSSSRCRAKAASTSFRSS
jgi:4-aminobutyrate aminotransferase-like enzyme